MSKRLRSRLACGLVMSSLTLSVGSVVGPTLGVPGYILPANSQTTPELKKLNPQFVTEPGCPVEVVGATTAFEIDGFGTPMAARHYIDYRNIGGRPIAAVKFRIAYVAEDGKIHQPYLNAPDAHPLEPGGTASQKWRGDKVDPKTAAVKIRVLMVKFSDGSVWESQKVNQTNAQQQEGFVPLQTESPGADLAENFTPGTPVQFKNYPTPQAGTFPAQSQTGAVPFKSTGTGNPGFEPGAFGTPVQMTTTPSAGAAGVPPANGGGSWDAPGAAAAPAASGAPATYAPAPATTYGARPTAPAVPVDPLSQIDAILGNPKKSPVAAPAVAPSVVTAPSAGRSAGTMSPPVPSVAPSMSGGLQPAAVSAPTAAAPALAPAAAPSFAPAAAASSAPSGEPALAPAMAPVAEPVAAPPATSAPSASSFAPTPDASSADPFAVGAGAPSPSGAASPSAPASPTDIPAASSPNVPAPTQSTPAGTTGGSMPPSSSAPAGTSGGAAASRSSDKVPAGLDDLLK